MQKVSLERDENFCLCREAKVHGNSFSVQFKYRFGSITRQDGEETEGTSILQRIKERRNKSFDLISSFRPHIFS